MGRRKHADDNRKNRVPRNQRLFELVKDASDQPINVLDNVVFNEQDDELEHNQPLCLEIPQLSETFDDVESDVHTDSSIDDFEDLESSTTSSLTGSEDSDSLDEHIADHYEDSDSDLANDLIERMDDIAKTQEAFDPSPSDLHNDFKEQRRVDRDRDAKNRNKLKSKGYRIASIEYAQQLRNDDREIPADQNSHPLRPTKNRLSFFNPKNTNNGKLDRVNDALFLELGSK